MGIRGPSLFRQFCIAHQRAHHMRYSGGSIEAWFFLFGVWVGLRFGIRSQQIFFSVESSRLGAGFGFFGGAMVKIMY
jgi:hypothetical protein